MAEHTDMKQLLCDISQRLTRIEDRLTVIENSTTNMDNHIGFVQSVYLSVQTPFNAMISWFNGTKNNVYLPSAHPHFPLVENVGTSEQLPLSNIQVLNDIESDLCITGPAL